MTPRKQAMVKYARLLFFVLPLLFAACGPSLPDEVADAMDRLPDQLDYNFHVKPILSDRCFACHGPDAQTQQADLRLDTEEGAYAALTSGNGHAIVPGKTGKSEMVRRILSDDPDVMMPTPESNLSLEPREIATLVRWIEQGAEYREHWAFTPPQKAELPVAGQGWAKNEIDRFVAARLELEGVAPSPEAERPYLIRRVYFDLTGLPPTLEEMDKWEGDESSDWYENMVDELLASPAYGERMATYWMDVARFADSEGYLDDFHHALWPYRDWVIKAYNENLPYDKFVEWQVGGDQFPNAKREQILATTFNRNHKQNSEGGIIPEEFRVEYVADRTATVGTAFMGLTVACARCHDHKYDPISQKNFYQLFGFFNQTVERGDAIFALNSSENGQMVPNKYAMNAGPTLPLPDVETEAIREKLLGMIAAKEKVIEEAEAAAAKPEVGPSTGEIDRVLAKQTVNHLTFDDATDRDRARGGEVFYSNIPKIPGPKGQAAELGEGSIAVNGKPSQFERSQPFTVSFWVKTPAFFADALVLYNSNGKNQGYRGWDIALDSNRVLFRFSHAYPYQSLTLRVEEPLRENEWRHFVWSYDGSSRAEGMRVYRDGKKIEPAVMRNHLVRSTVPYNEPEPLIYERYRGMVVGGRHYDPDFAGGAVDELRVLKAEAGDLLAAEIFERAGGKGKTEPRPAAIAEYHRLHQDETLLQLRAEIEAIRTREVETIDTVREVMVMGDDTRLRPTYILNRGVYDEHGEIVEPGVPESMLPWPEELPKNRYGLAKWLTHPENPLVSRVAVNQMWYLIFGVGLVETVEDFGNQGSLPTHPALLDWLAVDFRENGWDVKRLIRQYVTSATYRQSSKIREDLEERDPDNTLLARSHRYRRSAEMIRDNALAASGQLVKKIGGPSVFPYQPAGIWKEVNNHPHSPGYEVDTDEDGYRRTLYSFWKRNAPSPAMLVFDAALRGECQVRRRRSNTPMQALVLMNDPQTLEACRVLASKSLRESDSVGSAIDRVFRTLIGRYPTDREEAIIEEFYQRELAAFAADESELTAYLQTGFHATDLSPGAAEVAALARVANTVMNTSEGYYKN